MIDTIVITMTMRNLLGPEGNIEEVWSSWNRHTSRGYTTYSRNPTAEEQEAGTFPRLTGYRAVGQHRGIAMVNLEFSVPKLVLGNNLEELKEEQADEMLRILSDKLRGMGFEPHREALSRASVAKVHFSKNFLLPREFTASYVVLQLHKAYVNRRFEHREVRYRNNGEQMSIYTKSYSLEFYDKSAEMEHGVGGDLVIDSQRNVLRYEVRLTKKRKMKTLFNLLGFSPEPTLREVLSKERSQAVLKHYWEEVIARDSHVLFSQHVSAQELLRQILIVRPSIKARRALTLLGLVTMCRDEGGIGQTRNQLSQRLGPMSWPPIVRDLHEIAGDLRNLRHEPWYEEIERQLEAYEPIQNTGEEPN